MAEWSFITYYCVFSMLIIAYLLGSLPSAVWIGKRYYGIDIREHGSKNAGTTNMLRTLGKKAAALTLVCDILKGVVAVLIAMLASKIWKESDLEISVFITFLA